MENTVTVPISRKEANLVFKVVGDREIMLTFLPPTNKLYEKAPLYFIISGGGWEMESREAMIGFSKSSVETLREYGYAVVSIDYRTVSEEGIAMPDVITDCFDALRYICFYADVLGIDKYNVITSGHSAGGHLALMVAYANADDFKCETSLETDYKITATIPLSPITIMFDDGIYPKNHNLEKMSNRYRGCDDMETRKKTSPICYARSDCPPTFLCAGSSDDLVLCNSSELMYEALKKCGAIAQIVISHNGGHCFEPIGDVVDSYPNSNGIQEMLVDFVLKYTKP